MSGARPDPTIPAEEEDCVGWGPPTEPPASTVEAGAVVPAAVPTEEDQKSLCVAVLTMLISIPALVGSWCWPLLIAGMFSSLANINTAATRSFAHSLTFGFSLAVFTNIIQYAVGKTHKSRANKAPWARKWGPTICLIFATIFSMADLVRHLINDAWGTACDELGERQKGALCNATDNSSCQKYSKACYSQNVMNEFDGTGEGLHHLSVIGWVFTIFFTWTGFVLLFVGIFWLISFPQKFRAKWRALRAARSLDTRPLSA